LPISVGSFIIAMQPTHTVTQTCSKAAAGNDKQELSDKNKDPVVLKGYDFLLCFQVWQRYWIVYRKSEST